MSPPPRPSTMTSSSGAVPGPSRRSTLRLRVVLCLMLAALLVLGPLSAPALAEEARWQWPLDPPHRVYAPFDPPAHRYGSGHRGVDLATAAAQASVRAVEAGTVRFSGMVAGRGVVSVIHAGGLISTYEPVSGTLEPGATVQAGTVIGTMEDRPELAHCPKAACLHLGARRGEDYLDPMLLLGLRSPSVLLPWAGGAEGGQESSRSAEGLAAGAHAVVPAAPGPEGSDRPAVTGPVRMPGNFVGAGMMRRPGLA